MSGAWNPEKVAVFREEYMRFREHVQIDSKEDGQVMLGEHTYRAQIMLLDGIFDGLAHDIHDFKVLKSRQLGISTEARCLTMFWIGVHDGLRGSLVFDTSQHSEEARVELLTMLKNLPPSLKFPGIKRENRYLLQLTNGSMMNFASAGIRAGKGSGVLGRSSGLSFAHCSEICSWDNMEGVEAFKNALAENNPNRLYIWESTARGPGLWQEMWQEAEADIHQQRTIFLGFWSKDNQQIERGAPDFDRYAEAPISEDEARRIDAVRRLYGWQITIEQLAWWRRRMDPSAKQEGDANVVYNATGLQIQEQPFTAEEAWQITGSVFFDPAKLTELANKHVSNKFKTYTYSAGIEFVDCRINPAPNAKSVQLKVWEEPENDAVYIIAADPAFGINEHNDRSACQVLRAYADGLDQVAEYAWPLVNTRQFAWVIASLAGHYSTVGGTGKADVYLIIELNGPGDAVWAELVSLKTQLRHSYTPKQVEEAGLRNIFQNVRNYIYNRMDSMGAGHQWHFKTTGVIKVPLMERLRDFTSSGMIHIRSLDTLIEMKSITRDGDSIEAAGSKKDDRVLALALAVRCWEDRARKTMISLRRTREFEQAKKRMSIKDQVHLFNENTMKTFFARKALVRRTEASYMRQQTMRNRLLRRR